MIKNQEDDQDQEQEEQAPKDRPNALTEGIRERLFKSRTLIISGGIDQQLTSNIIAQLLAMSGESDKPIDLFINSQGGHVEAGDTIHDVIRFVKPRVRMIGTGWVASAGALIYVAARKEDRYCLPNTRFLLHQPAGGSSGTASDIAIEAHEIIKMRARINRIFARETGQPIERIESDTHRNFWLDAEQAVEYGLVSRIINSIDELD
jgi:ATP-dependent Clp protease protease subunit